MAPTVISTIMVGIMNMNPITTLLSTVLVGSFFATRFLAPTDPTNVFFKISTRGKCDREISVNNLDEIEFNPNTPTYVIIHGYPFGFPKIVAHSQNLRNSLLRREDCNVIVVNYFNLSHLDYPSKAKIMPEMVGSRIASLLKELQTGEKAHTGATTAPANRPYYDPTSRPYYDPVLNVACGN